MAALGPAPARAEDRAAALPPRRPGTIATGRWPWSSSTSSRAALPAQLHPLGRAGAGRRPGHPAHLAPVWPVDGWSSGPPGSRTTSSASRTRRSRSGPRSRSTPSSTAAARSGAGSPVSLVAAASLRQVSPGHTQPYDTIFQAMIFLTASAAGVLSRTKRASIQAAQSRADRAEAERDRQAARPPGASGPGSPASCTTWWPTTSA